MANLSALPYKRTILRRSKATRARAAFEKNSEKIKKEFYICLINYLAVSAADAAMVTDPPSVTQAVMFYGLSSCL